MDDYMFRYFVDECRTVIEDTRYVEIYNYSDPVYNTNEEHPLTQDEFDNFLHRKGAFEPPTLKDGVRQLSGLRFVIQKDAKHPDTFAAKVISLPKDTYETMVRVLHLPFRGIETSAVVGPFFWSALDQDDENPHLQIVHRKSDVLKKGKTRGWEVMLSYCFKTNVTTGFIKGTPSSDVVTALNHLKKCADQIAHPMLLSTIIMSYDLAMTIDERQRKARNWLRKLENAVSYRDEVDQSEQYTEEGALQVDGLNRDLVECHSQVMWKRPQAYSALLVEMEKAMDVFMESWSKLRPVLEGDAADKERVTVDKVHRSMLSRLDFYKVKLKGLENYIYTTLQRLKVQREALYNIISQREARLNLQIAGEQRRIAHATKRDSTSMKGVSLLGAVFLPGNLLASVFGMAFFNYEGVADPVSVDLWIYFALAIPITAIIVGMWLWYDRRREAKYAQDEADLEKDIERLEKDIMFSMRARTMSKAHTWNTISPAPK